MVQETEKPGVAVAEVCRRHGIATSLLFRWRVQFGLIARKNAATRDGDARRRRREPGARPWQVAGSGAAARQDDGYQDGDRAQPA